MLLFLNNGKKFSWPNKIVKSSFDIISFKCERLKMVNHLELSLRKVCITSIFMTWIDLVIFSLNICFLLICLESLHLKYYRCQYLMGPKLNLEPNEPDVYQKKSLVP